MIYRSNAVVEAHLITAVERKRLDLFNAEVRLSLENGDLIVKEQTFSSFGGVAPLAERGDWWVNEPRTNGRGQWVDSWAVVSADEFALKFSAVISEAAS